MAVGAALGLMLGSTTQQALADVTADFRAATIVSGRPYTPLGATKTILPATAFRLPPQLAPTDPADRDDGYVRVNLPFQYRFNGTLYSSVWINVNGFVLFSNTQPPNVAADDPGALFTASQPVNIVAPYFGDHYYRIGPLQTGEANYLPSEISYDTRQVGNRTAFVVEWRNLNINNEAIPSSVGNFQLYLYQSENSIPGSPDFQGDIEFAYGTVGGNGSTVITQGATIGIKGENGDFINALVFTGNINQASTDNITRSNLWPPSGATDNVIRLGVNVRLLVSGWGDGDADLSQVGKHQGLPQNRFVTANDARVILRAQALNQPLDSLRERNAFHGDVNHNGRYYYSTRKRDNTADSTVNNVPGGPIVRYRRAVEQRSLSDFDLSNPLVPADQSLPFLAGNPAFFFEATEYDAAIIMNYMSGRVPTLPWLLDTIVPYGRAGVNDKNADNIVPATAVKVNENIYRIPVQLSGYVKGAVATKFNVNGEILDVNGVQLGDNKVLAEGNGNTVVLSASGEFNESEPVVYITVKTTDANVTFSDIRFNDKLRSKQTIMVKSVEKADELLSNYPNPVLSTTTINFIAPKNGVYEVAIFDMLGNRVRTLKAEQMNEGLNQIEWNTTDQNGVPINAGMYSYRVQGEGLNINNTFMVVR
jgi:hypothetical protein